MRPSTCQVQAIVHIVHIHALAVGFEVVDLALHIVAVSTLSVAHFTNNSRRNFSVDQGFYPLGSCTMKYNPKINDRVADLADLALLHPYQDEATVQGMLALWELQRWLGEIAGLPPRSMLSADWSTWTAPT